MILGLMAWDGSGGQTAPNGRAAFLPSKPVPFFSDTPPVPLGCGCRTRAAGVPDAEQPDHGVERADHDRKAPAEPPRLDHALAAARHGPRAGIRPFPAAPSRCTVAALSAGFGCPSTAVYCPTTFHCLPLPFHRLSLPFHCLPQVAQNHLEKLAAKPVRKTNKRVRPPKPPATTPCHHTLPPHQPHHISRALPRAHVIWWFGDWLPRARC